MKAENILLEEDGYIKLTDFGLSKRLKNKNEFTSTFCGTPEYMAPEICNKIFSKPSDHGMAVDWWSVGILTYEMIVGCTPFYSSKRSATYRMIVNK